MATSLPRPGPQAGDSYLCEPGYAVCRAPSSGEASSAAEREPVPEHGRVVEEQASMIGEENRADVLESTPPRGPVESVGDSPGRERDDPVRAEPATAQHALIGPE